MERLDNLIGKIERFIGNSFCYLTAKNIIWAHNKGYKTYLGIEISQEIFNEARDIVSVRKIKY